MLDRLTAMVCGYLQASHDRTVSQRPERPHTGPSATRDQVLNHPLINSNHGEAAANPSPDHLSMSEDFSVSTRQFRPRHNNTTLSVAVPASPIAASEYGREKNTTSQPTYQRNAQVASKEAIARSTFLESASRSEYEILKLQNDELREQSFTSEKRQRLLIRKLKESDAANAKITERAVAMAKRIKGTESELNVSKQEAQKLHENLEQCKERIFGMQPVEQVTDAQLGKQYQSLCETIEDWVERQFGGLDSLFENVLEIEWIEPYKGMLIEYLVTDGELNVALQCPSASDAMLRLLMDRHLQNFVLHEGIVFFGLSDAYRRFLLDLKTEMRKLEPRRNEETLQMWSTDVQRALGRFNDLPAARSKYIANTSSVIGGIFFELMPGSTRNSFQLAECQEIVSEAADFGDNIRLSAAAYQFLYDFVPKSHPESRVLYLADFQKFKVIDQASGQPVRGSTIAVVDGRARVGEKLCVIHPALIRQGRGGDKDVLLVKATILVKLDRPVVRKGKGRKPDDTCIKGTGSADPTAKDVPQASEKDCVDKDGCGRTGNCDAEATKAAFV